MYHAMKQYCELTKPVSNEQPSMINIKTQRICNNNDKNVDKSIKSEELRLSMTSCSSQNNNSLKIKNMSTISEQNLTINNEDFNKMKVNLKSYLKKKIFLVNILLIYRNL